MDIQYASQEDASFEAAHWWIRARFLLLDRSLQQLSRVQPISVLEIGCGTAVNLHYLEQHYSSRLTRLVGVDPYAKESSNGLLTLQREIPTEGEFDLVLAMDVLEHTERPADLLQAARLRLKPQGFLLVTVPAFQWLWTSYDEITGHKRRYSRQDLEHQLAQEGFEIQELFFLFSAIFPIFLLQRLWMKFAPSNPRIFKPVHPWVNAVLFGMTYLEAHSWMPYNGWFGSSIVALARAWGGV